MIECDVIDHKICIYVAQFVATYGNQSLARACLL